MGCVPNSKMTVEDVTPELCTIVDGLPADYRDLLCTGDRVRISGASGIIEVVSGR